MSVIGRPCAAFYNGEWKSGTIMRHDVKRGWCWIKTVSCGTIKVTVYRIRMTDKEDD